MPELPEVEVTCQLIKPHLIGRTIQSVQTTQPNYFFTTPPAELRRRLAGRTPTAVERLGKYILIHLDDTSTTLLHLGMTGQLFVSGSSSVRLLSAEYRQSLKPSQQTLFKPDPHTHLQFRFKDGGAQVWLRDVRKFGKCLWIPPGETPTRLLKLGVDALTITGEQLHAATRRRSGATKLLLLDQTVLAGVGNIYADEALFIAGIHPARPAAQLSLRQCGTLARAIQQVLKRSIEVGGSSIDDYIRPDGTDGGYQQERLVYGRTDQPCTHCGAAVVRSVLGARSTHYCPHCQH